MKKTVLCFLCALVLLGSVSVQAADIASEGAGVTCGAQLSWAVEGSTLYITGTGDMYDFSTGAPWASYRYSISRVVISDGVTSVGTYAFQDYDTLTSVEFGNSIVSIGKDAFSGCDGLTSITLPATFKKFGENSFRSCSNLKEIHCSGGFPRFDLNCLWDTYATIYYSASNPWSVSLIQELESAFQNRIEFRSSDGTDPYVPTQATQPAVPETTAPQETFWVTEPTTLPVYTQATIPVYTEATVPVYTQPTTTPTLPVQTLPTTQPTQETIVFGNQFTQTAEPYQYGSATGGGSIFGVLIILIVLAMLATGALLFRAAGQTKKKKKNRYRR